MSDPQMATYKTGSAINGLTNISSFNIYISINTLLSYEKCQSKNAAVWSNMGERNLSELEFVRILFFALYSQSWKLPELEIVRIGICQNWNLSELELVRILFLPFIRKIGNCQNWNLSELEFVRIGICQNWNLSEF